MPARSPEVIMSAGTARATRTAWPVRRFRWPTKIRHLRFPDKTMNRIILTALGLALPLVANAIELDWSGFGTLGYTQSDKAYRYQRWIDNDGTLLRDSVIGGQVDFRFNQQWGAAIQGKIAPDRKSTRLNSS